MRIFILLLLTPLMFACQNHYFESDTIIDNMKRVADYELANPSHHYSKDDPHNFVNGWVPATFYIAMVPLYEATGDYKYIDEVKKWGERSEWGCAPRLRHADDIVCGQIYLDLYRVEKEDIYIESLLNRMNTILSDEIPGREDWYWCDALFMAPPVYAMAGSMLDNKAYLDFNDRMYWDVYDYLFDKEESLFFRDSSYFDQKSPNGEKVFWGRGNGWILGGLSRLIPYISNQESKQRYVDLFKVLANRVVDLQQPDGMWRSNLLDATHFNQKEASGSGFYVYSLAWGINNGILDKETFLPIVKNGWSALCQCIDDQTGMLGWVQPIGAAPDDTKISTTMSYGAGAFILAGTEMLKLLDDSKQ